MQDEQKTVRVRIAVAVDRHGDVAIMKIDDKSPARDPVREAFSYCLDFVESGEARYIVTADLALPSPPPTVAGSVTEEK